MSFLMKFVSLVAMEIVILTTSSAASDENLIKMKTFTFQWRDLRNTQCIQGRRLADLLSHILFAIYIYIYVIAVYKTDENHKAQCLSPNREQGTRLTVLSPFTVPPPSWQNTMKTWLLWQDDVASCFDILMVIIVTSTCSMNVFINILEHFINTWYIHQCKVCL